MLCCLMVAAQAQESDTRWRLRVMDLRNQARVDATIRFTNDAADSCIGGTWRRIVVESSAMQDKAFFPLDEPLSYTIERGELKLGRTQVCDGYLFVSGKLDPSKVKGDYYSLGWGVRELGSFSLEKMAK